MAKDIPTTKDGYCPLYGFTGKCDAVKRLKAENERLKDENKRLKAENEKLKKCATCGTLLSRDCEDCRRKWSS